MQNLSIEECSTTTANPYPDLLLQQAQIPNVALQVNNNYLFFKFRTKKNYNFLSKYCNKNNNMIIIITCSDMDKKYVIFRYIIIGRCCGKWKTEDRELLISQKSATTYFHFINYY